MVGMLILDALMHHAEVFRICSGRVVLVASVVTDRDSVVLPRPKLIYYTISREIVFLVLQNRR